MANPKQPKVRTRYSIGEWYGRGFETLSPAEIHRQANLEIQINGLTGTPCPFKVGVKCNKKGGVCSLRQYQQTGDGPVSGVGPVVTTCPQRFLEAKTIFRWVGEVLLQTADPIVLGEIGFLDRLRPERPPPEGEEQDARDFIGRIDSVLVHPSRNPIDWCALELQAVYFSGTSMPKEFKMLSEREMQTHRTRRRIAAPTGEVPDRNGSCLSCKPRFPRFGLGERKWPS